MITDTNRWVVEIADRNPFIDKWEYSLIFCPTRGSARLVAKRLILHTPEYQRTARVVDRWQQ